MGIWDTDAESIETLLEKKMLLGILEEALESLLPDERELAEKVFGEQIPVSEFAKESGLPSPLPKTPGGKFGMAAVREVYMMREGF